MFASVRQCPPVSLSVVGCRSGIYEITNGANGKRYIGSAVDLPRRQAQHASDLRKNVHRNARLQNAWNKYGPGAFGFRVLLVCAPQDLLHYEQRFIDGLCPEYNIAPKAGSQLGAKRTAETRAKISAANKGRKLPPEVIAKRIGRKQTMETRAKRSATSAGRQFSPEHCARISAAQTGVKFTAERCAQMSAAMKGKPNTAEQRAKISAALVGRKKSPETRAKMSAAQQKRHAR